MKYLVLKGAEGLGVRLWTLGNAIELARRSDRALHVDWTDSVYGGKGYHPFYDFFEVSGVPVMRQLTDIPFGKAHNPVWQRKRGMSVYDFYRKGNYANEQPLRRKLGFWSDIKDYIYHPGDVLVMARCHNRQSECMRRISFNRYTKEFIASTKANLGLKNGEYVCVNVRFTDKHMPVEILVKYFHKAKGELEGSKYASLPVLLTTDSVTARDIAKVVFEDRVLWLPRWLDPEDKKNHQNPKCPDRYARYLATIAEFGLMMEAKVLVHFDGYNLHGNHYSKSSFATAALELGQTEEILINRTELTHAKTT